MPSLHLPRAPCDIFVYDFSVRFSGIVGGYGVCVYINTISCDFCNELSMDIDRDNSYGGCAEIARTSCNFSAVIAQSPQAFYENSTEPVRFPCRGWYFCNISTENRKGICNAHTICPQAIGLRFLKMCNFFLYKIVEATEPVNPYDNCTAVTTAARRPYNNGLTGSVRVL